MSSGFAGSVRLFRLHFARLHSCIVSMRSGAGAWERLVTADRWSAARRHGADARHRPPRRIRVALARRCTAGRAPSASLCNAPSSSHSPRPFPAAFRCPLYFWPVRNRAHKPASPLRAFGQPHSHIWFYSSDNEKALPLQKKTKIEVNLPSSSTQFS